jgi:ASPIC and UnbV/FG-GAP-like repeat
MRQGTSRVSRRLIVGMLIALLVVTLSGIALLISSANGLHALSAFPGAGSEVKFEPRQLVDSSGFNAVLEALPKWQAGTTLAELSTIWEGIGARGAGRIDEILLNPAISSGDRVQFLVKKATLLNYDAKPERAYEVLAEARSLIETDEALMRDGLYTVIFLQAVTALRRGETDNCVMCRGESSCILPIAPAAQHTIPAGSQLAIRHFTEYLEQFPQDGDARWLLNVAHMTLGEYPGKVDPKYLVSIDHFLKSEFDIGKFRDIGEKVKVNRFNMAGGAVMEDFDHDGLLDLATTSFDPSLPMTFYRNAGDGSFVLKTKEAGLSEQLGGKNLVQTDYNNDGHLDLFISRGAWLNSPVRQSLLKNNGNGTFSDVTESAGLLDPVNSTYSCWGDYDNDGWLDVYIICELQTNRLYHNRGDGTFEDVSGRAGVGGDGKGYCKGANWVDFDNDDFPDLFVTNLKGMSKLYHNNRNGTFSEVTESMGIDGPQKGFSCWAWDYDNDGWLDIFATCYDYSIGDVVKGLAGEAHTRMSNRLWHNVKGERFEDKTKESGLDMVFATMGSNFGDVDNDGYLDFYLGTGTPEFETLFPNRMFKNVEGRRFAEITASSGTGNLQKGHGVSFADWDRDGDLDMFIEMGGASLGDRYHNILFENPGQGNHWLSVKLVGKKTNRAALGARIKVVAGGELPQTIYRHVSTGSSWGANPLEQHIGLQKADRVRTLEIHWPSSGTTQVFRDIAADQAIEVTELDDRIQTLPRKPIALK